MIYFFFEDPAHNRFLVGAAPTTDGGVTLFVGDCLGGQLQNITVAIDQADGFGDDDVDLWSVDAGEGDGVALIPAEVLVVQLGSVPTGMTETLAFEGEYPTVETIQVIVETDRQGDYGFFFEMDDLKDGELFAGGHGHVSPDSFEALAANLC